MSPLTPDQAMQVAFAHHRAGHLREAEAIYRQILAAQPDHPGALHHLGLIARSTGHPEPEIQLLRRAVELAPRDAGAHQDLGETLANRGNLGESEREYLAAMALDPNSAAILNDLGTLYRKQQRYAEALSLIDRALAIAPELPQAHANRGQLLADVGRLPESLQAFDASLRIRPDHVATILAKARALFLAGDLKPAFELYEHRMRSGDVLYPALNEPRWDGQDATGKAILVIAEQGVGDTIQFVRYLPQLRERCAQVILLCLANTRALFESIPGIRVIGSGEARQPFDYHVSVLGLARIFGTTLQTIPSRVPYLAADPTRVQPWRNRVGDAPGLKVGLVWAGNPTHKGDRHRSIALTQFAILRDVPNVNWFSLQMGPATSQLPAAPFPIVDLAPGLNDFADTAAALQALDLLITVDTSCAHLAGALARPVWTMLQFDPDWRWMLDRFDTPWYPTMRLFRQTTPGDWNLVVESIASALAEFRVSRSR
jgi:tetratricopeptide (TPR) repeat protein